MKVAEGRFYAQGSYIYTPKAIVTALKLEDRDLVEFHVTDQEIVIRKGEKP